jgi:HAD superfamily hydrolase (TIGR01509 family)
MSRSALPAAVLWDMDGTVVDTEPLWFAAETALVESYGGTWSHEDAVGMIGSQLPRSARLLIARGVPLTVDEVLDGLAARLVAAQADGPPWLPGAFELLTAVAEAGVPQALVTSSYRSFITPTLASGFFTTAVVGDEVSHGKPHPEPYLEAARRLGADVAACVVVEDSAIGVGAGLAAGARVLGVTGFGALPDDPRLSRADSLVDVTLDDLRRIAAGEVLDLRADAA